MQERIHIFSEPQALINLGLNKAFREGFLLKRILKSRVDIVLIMDEVDFQSAWADSENPLRKFFDSYDLPAPRAINGLTGIYKDPSICYKLDPFAIWLFNRPVEDVCKFRDYMGVWAVNPAEITDDYFEIDHPKEYREDDEVAGEKDNGWGNYLAQIPKDLPPINSIIINDRHLVCTDNEYNYRKQIVYGLTNLRTLLNEIMPMDLKVPFHILVYCLHAETPGDFLNRKLMEFIREVQDSRPSYPVEIEFVFSKALHKRDLYSNYFKLNVDRGFNVFKTSDMTKIAGENKLTLKTYLSNPLSTGDTEFLMASRDIADISEQSKEILIEPIDEPFEAADKDWVKTHNYKYQSQHRIFPEKDTPSFTNRLFR